MPIDFTQPLKTMDGINMTDLATREGGTETVTLTLDRVACAALLGNVPHEQPADADEHMKRFALAGYLKGNAAALLTAEHVAMLKARIAKAYSNAMIVGQACAMVDPDALVALNTLLPRAEAA